ncbi:hypothetical protein U0E08_31950, partial [Burkholderia pseudomallei]
VTAAASGGVLSVFSAMSAFLPAAAQIGGSVNESLRVVIERSERAVASRAEQATYDPGGVVVIDVQDGRDTATARRTLAYGAYAALLVDHRVEVGDGESVAAQVPCARRLRVLRLPDGLPSSPNLGTPTRCILSLSDPRVPLETGRRAARR